MNRLAIIALAAAAVLVTARPADACGGFVAYTETARVNDAIELVVARDGTRTFLSVRNRYRGPVEDFAILIPVPQVLHEDDVKTLDASVFDALDELTAPEMELVRERDPCYVPDPGDGNTKGSGTSGSGGGGGGGASVRVEAQFQVGEYDIEILSAKHAAGLTTWLTEHDYKISKTMAPLLRPYVDGGSKFFVAKVDPKRVTFVDGVATLSPLRFRYDSDELSLPLRLSTANSPGTQDVLIHVIGPHSVEAANRPNVKLPSGLQIAHDAPGDFTEFYEALVTATLAKHPGAVITEFAGQPYSLSSDLLGPLGAMPDPLPQYWGFTGSFTRLHLRLDRTGKQDDLVLRDTKDKLEFRPRYKKVVPWTSAPWCPNPNWGVYEPVEGGGAGSGTGASYGSIGFGRPVPEDALGLAEYLSADAPNLGVTALRKPPPHPAPGTGTGTGTDIDTDTDIDAGGGGNREPAKPRSSGGCCETGGASGFTIALALLVLVLAKRRR